MTFHRASVASAPPSDIARGLRKSAEIVRDPKLALARDRDAVRALVKDVIAATFGAPSAYAMFCAAAKRAGCHPDTIERIYGGLTDRPDYAIILVLCRAYREKTGRSSPLALHLMKIMGEA